jgi:hypothetical protein
VPVIEDAFRLLQSADADAIYAPGAVCLACHTGTERAHGGGSAQHIFALEEAFDAGASNRKPSQDEGAV